MASIPSFTPIFHHTALKGNQPKPENAEAKVMEFYNPPLHNPYTRRLPLQGKQPKLKKAGEGKPPKPKKVFPFDRFEKRMNVKNNPLKRALSPFQNLLHEELVDPADGENPAKELEANLFNRWRSNQRVKKVTSYYISSMPERILKAPNILDDFYTHLLTWSPSTRCLTIALVEKVYSWNERTHTITLLKELLDEDDIVTALAEFPSKSPLLALGHSANQDRLACSALTLFDREAQRDVGRCYIKNEEETTYCGALAVGPSGNRVALGGEGFNIVLYDTRKRNPSARLQIDPEDRVCTILWDRRDEHLLVSGMNGNNVLLWDIRKASKPLATIPHKGAVKAVAFHPTCHNKLFTGGATNDNTLYAYDISSQPRLIMHKDTKFPITSLTCSRDGSHLFSGHGDPACKGVVWSVNYNSRKFKQIKELTGHTNRILHTALSPDGTTVCTASADETLHFWKVFPPQGKKGNPNSPFALRTIR